MKRIVIALLFATFASPVYADDIADRCEAEWPGNYRMQDHCIGRQEEGVKILSDALDSPDISRDFLTDILEPIVNGCAEQWSDEYGINYRMAAYCMNKQLNALTRLRNR